MNAWVGGKISDAALALFLIPELVLRERRVRKMRVSAI